MVVYGVAYLVIGECLPCLWHNLLLWVCPVVRVVEVEQEVHARLLYALCHGERMLQVAVAVALRVAELRLGVYKEAQTDVVKSVVAHDVESIAFNATITKLHAHILLPL